MKAAAYRSATGASIAAQRELMELKHLLKLLEKKKERLENALEAYHTINTEFPSGSFAPQAAVIQKSLMKEMKQ